MDTEHPVLPKETSYFLKIVFPVVNVTFGKTLYFPQKNTEFEILNFERSNGLKIHYKNLKTAPKVSLIIAEQILLKITHV